MEESAAAREGATAERAVRAMHGGPDRPDVLGEQAAFSAGARELHAVPLAGKLKRLRAMSVWIGLACVLVALAAIVVFVIVPRRVPRLNPDMSFRTVEVPFVEMGYSGLSRDGKWVAFSARDAKNEWSIYFMNVVKGNPRRLISESFVRFDYAEVSPDGSEVLFGSVQQGKASRAIYVVSSLGGASRKIAEPGCGARWRPDGQLIGYLRTGTYTAPSQSGKREFWTVRPDGSENRLQFVDSVSYEYSGFCFDWSPDGSSVAWLKSHPGYAEIFIRDLKSGKERRLTSDKKPIDELAWAQNNQIFYTSSKSGNSNIWMIPAKGGESVQVTKGTGPDYGVRVSADGKRLLYLERRTIHYLWTVDIDGRNARQLTFENQALGGPRFSPDKKRISFDVYSSDPLRPGGQIFVMESDGTNRTQLTSGAADCFSSSWSPDGRYMTYSSRQISEPYDSSKVYLIDVANPSTKRLIGKGIDALWINDEEFVSSTSLPELRSVLYSIRRSDPVDMSQDSTWEVPLPDGKHILFWDTREGREGWYLKAVGKTEEAPIQIVTSEYFATSYPTVSLRYLLSMQANGELWRIGLPEGKRERLPGISYGINPFSYDIQTSYDDKQVVYLKGKLDSRLVLIENLFK